MEDAITGTRLRVADQTIDIGMETSRGVQKEGWSSAANMKDLAPLLLEPSAYRAIGAHEVVPVLVEATAGTGKTWSSIQLAHQLAVRSAASNGGAVELVPVRKRLRIRIWLTFAC